MESFLGCPEYQKKFCLHWNLNRLLQNFMSLKDSFLFLLSKNTRKMRRRIPQKQAGKVVLIQKKQDKASDTTTEQESPIKRAFKTQSASLENINLTQALIKIER